jgi:hypothetical protein
MISDSDDVEICTVDDILNELYPEISSDSSDEETETVAQYSNPDIPIVTVPQGSNTPPYVPPLTLSMKKEDLWPRTLTLTPPPLHMNQKGQIHQITTPPNIPLNQ